MGDDANGLPVWCNGIVNAIIATRKSKDRHYNDQNKNNKKD